MRKNLNGVDKDERLGWFLVAFCGALLILFFYLHGRGEAAIYKADKVGAVCNSIVRK